MTLETPIYGLKYIGPGEPVRDTRAALEDNAFTIEAALQAGGVAATGASDLLTVSGRVSVLETANTTENTLTLVTPGASFANWNASGYLEKLAVGKPRPGRAELTGMLRITAALTAGTSYTLCTLPTGFRPANIIPRYVPATISATAAPSWHRVNIATTGVVTFIPSIALAVDSYMPVAIALRTVEPT